jgi:hypothetical protein
MVSGVAKRRRSRLSIPERQAYPESHVKPFIAVFSLREAREDLTKFSARFPE